MIARPEISILSDNSPKLGSRLLTGAIAGFAGTLAMTAAMRRMHEKLPAKQRYPLTPREIVDSAAGDAGTEAENELSKDVTTAAHFAYGAATGALMGAANVAMGPVSGGIAGVGVWLASYMGWIPTARLLKPATNHPPRRNVLMIAAHIVWGVSTARAMRELALAREMIFDDGPDKDAPPEGGAEV
ncbi:hypothetical protein [Sphingosinicella humi]|uniref:hypothetical protein n=1 Tax=Allosphingosinicella humi TaxID=2068657 RepID=UPI001A9CB12E|nr:hypothetical protein [Sphingosinicella humi]